MNRRERQSPAPDGKRRLVVPARGIALDSPARCPAAINGRAAPSRAWPTVGPTVSSEQLPALRQIDRVVGRRSEKRHSPPESGGITTGRAVGAASASLRLDRRFAPAFL
jgi:hypothetical protein